MHGQVFLEIKVWAQVLGQIQKNIESLQENL